MKNLAIVTLALGTASFGEVSIFHGQAGGVGNVRVHTDGAFEAPALLQGIALLPFDFVGRTRLDELASDRPRLREDVPGASRLVLPQQGGSLYHYRGGPALGAVFGLMLVGADGVARSVWEAPGTGVGGNVDPLVPRVAVSPSGDAVLVATTTAAGGNLLEIDLSTGQLHDRTPNLPPTSFSLAGLALKHDWGVGAGSSGVLRFQRQTAAVAEAVPFPGAAPAWFGGDVVLSGDGLVAATTAGSGPTSSRIYTFGPIGTAQWVIQTESHLAGAGFQPESPNGPSLSLSHQGDTCAWITEGATREAWMAPTAPQPNTLVQITNDVEFAYTLDEIGVLFFLGSGRLVLAVGTQEDGLMGMEKVDVFRVTGPVTGQAPVTQNLSMTSSYTGAPFDYGTIDPVQMIRMPGYDNLLVLDDANDRLLGVPTDYSGAFVLAEQVKRIALLERSGAAVMLVLERDSSLDICRLPVAKYLSMETIASLPEGLQAHVPVVDTKGSTSFVLADALGEWLPRLFLPKPKAELFQPTPAAYGPTLGFTAAGDLVFSVESAAETTFYAWPLNRKYGSLDSFVAALADAGDPANPDDADEAAPGAPSGSSPAFGTRLPDTLAIPLGPVAPSAGPVVLLTTTAGFFLPGPGG